MKERQALVLGLSLSCLAHSFPNRRDHLLVVDHPIHGESTSRLGRRAWRLSTVESNSLPNACAATAFVGTSRAAQVTAQRRRCVSQWDSFVSPPANTSRSAALAASSALSASSSYYRLLEYPRYTSLGVQAVGYHWHWHVHSVTRTPPSTRAWRSFAL